MVEVEVEQQVFVVFELEIKMKQLSVIIVIVGVVKLVGGGNKFDRVKCDVVVLIMELDFVKFE